MNYYWNRNDEIENDEEPEPTNEWYEKYVAGMLAVGAVPMSFAKFNSYREVSTGDLLDAMFAEMIDTPEAKERQAQREIREQEAAQRCAELNWNAVAIDDKYGHMSLEAEMSRRHAREQHPERFDLPYMSPEEVERMMDWCQ